MTGPIDITNGIPNARPSRGIPKPFQRKRIEVGRPADEIRREWRWALPEELREGDTLPGIGSVMGTMGVFIQGGGFVYDIWGGEENEIRVDGLRELWVFTYPRKPEFASRFGWIESEVQLHAPEA